MVTSRPRAAVVEASADESAHRLRSACGAFDVVPVDKGGKVRGSVSVLKPGPFSPWAASLRGRPVARRAGAGRDLVASIAYEAGFNDVSYFNKAFRKAYGTTPGALSARRGA